MHRIPEAGMALEFSWMTAANLSEIGSFMGVEIRSEKYAEMARQFEQGASCFAAYHQGCLISVGWSIPPTDLSDHASPSHSSHANQVAMFDWYTSPIFEPLGVGEARVAQELAFYAEKGFSCLVICDSSDRSAQKTVTALGFRLTGTSHSISVFGMPLLGSQKPPDGSVTAVNR